MSHCAILHASRIFYKTKQKNYLAGVRYDYRLHSYIKTNRHQLKNTATTKNIKTKNT